jgi:hypothetical protein
MKYNIYYEKAMLFDKILTIINWMIEQWIKKWFIASKLWIDGWQFTRFINWATETKLVNLQKYYNLIK